MAKKPEGMLMAPNSNSGSSNGGRKKHRTDKVPLTKEEDHSTPMEVVFKTETFRKLIVWTLGPMLLTLIGAISAFFYFYHQTNSHIGDPTIHLTRGERSKLETKGEARVERKKLKEEITNHFDVKVREIRVEQAEQVRKIGKKLETDQRVQINKILIEVKKARQDIRDQ